MPKKRSTDWTEGFLKWWNSYPVDRRRGKAQSFELWRKFKLEERADELTEKIERLKVTLWRGKERKYIKTSYYYLKHERFEDDLVPLTPETMGGRISANGVSNLQAAQEVLENLGDHHGANGLPAFPGRIGTGSGNF